MKKSLPFLLLLTCLASCISHRDMLILKNIPQNADSADIITNQSEIRVQPDDLLAITVSSYNLEASKPFGSAEDARLLAQSMSGMNYTAEMLTGYFVDAEGFIDFPVLGRVDVNKKTISEVKDHLFTMLKTYLKDPVVNVRILNFKVTVLGEVKNPGLVRLSNKRLTVLEAIGMAGDLTTYSNRTNVLVVREKNGKRYVKRLNLQKNDCLESPFYYLQQNDIVYVEPNKTKVNTVADKSSRILAWVSAGVSALTLSLYASKF